MNPTGIDAILVAAGEAMRSNRPEAALELAERALDMDPSSLAAKFVAGIGRARCGDASGAIPLLLPVLEVDPRHYEALITLAGAYREAGELARSREMAERAITVRPGDPQAQNQLGRTLLAGRRMAEAEAVFANLVACHPAYAPAQFNRGKLKQLQGQDAEAAEAYSRAASLEPNAQNLVAFGQALLALNDLERANEVSAYCVEHFPRSAPAHLLRCGVLTELQQPEEAETHLQAAIENDPAGRDALATSARQLPLGHIDAALASLRGVIAENPGQVAAYEALVRNQRIGTAERNLVHRMRTMLEEGALAPTEEAALHYALGKAHEDLGDFGLAMARYDEANRIVHAIKLGGAPFDEARYSRQIETISAIGSPSIEGVERSETPILIVGMMRSGTTLVEHILASHPDVCGAGEQLFWSRNWSRAVSDGKLVEEELVALGMEYVAMLERIGGGARRVTDKMPGNFMVAGLIHAALPNARIVHVRRDPLDTCLSIWATPNHAVSEGGHTKSGIVAVYRQYLRLAERWREILPADRFFELDYEALVTDQEGQTRRLLEFCSLEWCEACLRPEKSRRNVSTLSVWQVRQPVYRTSVERWRRFEPWLGEFRQLLD